MSDGNRELAVLTTIVLVSPPHATMLLSEGEVETNILVGLYEI